MSKTKEAILHLFDLGLGIDDGLTNFYQTEDSLGLYVVHTEETIDNVIHHHEEYEDFDEAFESFCKHTAIKPE